jgi:hypothetical protein
MKIITSGWWNVSEKRINTCWKKSGHHIFIQNSLSSLEDINVSEELWEDVSSKLHLDSILKFEEFNVVDNNLETEPLLLYSAVLESLIGPSGEIRSDSEDEEEDTNVMTSVTLLEASECSDKLKTFVVKHEGVPGTLFKSNDKIKKYVKFHIKKRKFLIISQSNKNVCVYIYIYIYIYI